MLHFHVAFLYPLKFSENAVFTDVFRGYAKVMKLANLVKVVLNEFKLTIKMPG